ncbi:unnamed protein product [Adineta steineri]|uniref:Neurabin-1-like protein n=1 Tax=Adineta steineri TaxID=433720 RepID=A0A813TVX3_9BILA|nr:unnamed protein product [Adineta steineri]
MADILIQPAVPSLFTHTESASSLIVDSPTADSNNNTTIHHTRTSPNHNNNNNSNNSNTTNKYIGHVSRLRSVFTQYALTLNDLKPGEHRSRYSDHHHQGFVSPVRGIADGADEHSLSPPTPILPLATTSSSTIIERSRSLSNPRILDNNTLNMNLMRNGISTLTVSDNSSATNNSSNDDHTIRFRKAKEMFQTLEEEAQATRTIIPSTTIKQNRQNDPFISETYQPDLMHNGQMNMPIVNTEHIPDLIIDHRQQQQQQQQQQMKDSLKTNDLNSNRMRDVPIQFISTSSSTSPTHSDRSFTSIPIHRSVPPPSHPPQTESFISNEDVPYAMVNRKQINSDQHYDFPADAIQQLKKQQRDDDSIEKPSNEEIANRIVASILPSNILKRMDHLNTVFIKPTTIDRPLPKLSFQENDTQEPIIIKDEEKKDNISITQEHEQEQEQEQEDEQEQKWIDNPMLNGIDYINPNSTSSSPIFYEKPGLPEPNDDEKDITLSPNGTRRVQFSNAPIRVYPTYSPSEYNRRNDDIDPFSASAEYELEKRIEKMHVFHVEIEKGPDGLGISVLGMGVGADSGLEKLGIFVKSLNPQGVIARDGRIQIGDQIIEVDEHSLVGVTHTHATSVLKSTSGLVRFVIGREKDVENSEILRLIQQSLQMDQERNEMSRALQHHHDTYNERHLTDDGFSNLEFNDQDRIDDDTIKPPNHHELAKIHEKNYEQMWSMTEKQSRQDEFDILKQRYESLEKTLANVEKEKEYYQKIYEQTKKDFEHIEEKYLKAKKLIKELQDRETEFREQTDKNDQQQKKILELTKKTEELERILTNSGSQLDRLTDNSSVLTRITKLPSTSTESVLLRPPDIPERIPIRSRTSSGQNILTTERLPARNTPATSSVRLPSASIEKLSNNKLSNQHDFEVDRSPLLNHSIQMDKTQIAKTRPRNLPSKRLSNPLLDEVNNNHQNEDSDIKTSNIKISSVEETTKVSSTNHKNTITDEFIEVKDWTSDQCIQWLTAQEMTSFIPIFLNRNIDGEKLLLLDSTKMKAMGIKSSKDRDHLKTKLKELKHAELDRMRERLLSQQPTTFQHSVHSGNRLRSSSMTKLKERRLFGGSGGK